MAILTSASGQVETRVNIVALKDWSLLEIVTILPNIYSSLLASTVCMGLGKQYNFMIFESLKVLPKH